MVVLKTVGIECWLKSSKTHQQYKEYETRKTIAKCNTRKNVQYVGITEGEEFYITVVLNSSFNWGAHNAISLEVHFDFASEVKHQITIPRSSGGKQCIRSGQSQETFDISLIEKPVGKNFIEPCRFAFKRRTSDANSTKAPETVQHGGLVWLEISRVQLKDVSTRPYQTVLDRETKKSLTNPRLRPSSQGIDYAIQLVPAGKKIVPSASAPRPVHSEKPDYILGLPKQNFVDEKGNPVIDEESQSCTGTPPRTLPQPLLDVIEVSPADKGGQRERYSTSESENTTLLDDHLTVPSVEAQIQLTEEQISAQLQKNVELDAEIDRLETEIIRLGRRVTLKRKHEVLVNEQNTGVTKEAKVEILKKKCQQLQSEIQKEHA
ncbi:MAG: hypothetical protein Q9160_002416 [Pyrenula sp. 1 TL-2023]